MENMQSSQLFRSKTDRVFGGVAGGLAKYFNTDPLLLRILFVLLAIFGGGGVIIYIVLWIAIREETDYSFNQNFNSNMENQTENQTENTGNDPFKPDYCKRKNQVRKK